MDFLHKNNLAKFLGETGEASSNIFNKAGLLTETGVPFGKLIAYISKQVIEISDKDKAFQKAIGLTYFSTFCKALLQYQLQPKINEARLAVFGNGFKQSFKAETFDLQDFNNNEIIRTYNQLFQDTVLNQPEITESDKRKVQQYINDYLKIHFFELVENEKAVYAKINEYFNSKQYPEYQKLYKKEKYRNALKNLYHEIVMNDEKGMTLADIYIEPFFNVYEHCLDKKDARLEQHKKSYSQRETQQGFITLDSQVNIHQAVNDFLLGQDTLDIYKGFKREMPQILLVLGYPGQGKTSFCKRFLNDALAGQSSALGQEIYFIRLRGIDQVEQLITGNIVEELRKEAEEQAGSLTEIELEISEKEFKKAIWVLDGLDEIYMQANLGLEQVDIICRNLIKKTEDNKDLKIILTSRYGYVNLENFKHDKDKVLILQLQELSKNLQEQWLAKYQTFHPETWLTPTKLQEFNQSGNHTFRYVRELITQPLLLHFIASTSQELKQDSNRAEVYEQLFSDLLQRKYANNEKLETLKGIEAEDLRELIREIAFAIFQTGKTYIRFSELQKSEIVKDFLQKMNRKAEDFDSVIRGIMINFYFQQVKAQDAEGSKPDYALEFLHKSLLEYMVAEKIFTTIQDEFLDKNSKGKYILNDSSEVLKLLNKLFARQNIGRSNAEVIDYLIQIIQNADKIIKSELSQRLAHFLDEAMQKDFLASYDAKSEQSPIDMCINTFYGYWTILSYLNQEAKQNFIKNENTKISLAFFLKTSYFPKLNLAYQNLSEISLNGAYLSGADLRGADLSGTNLSSAYLRGAGLNGAILSRAYLVSAILSRAYLIGADLSFTRLRGANVSDADLSDADLNCADLSNANLGGVDLKGAYLCGADLSGADLSDADLTDTNLTGAIIEDEDWLVSLAEQNVIGYEDIITKYQIITQINEDTGGFNYILEEKPTQTE
jgi:uncharacterized protein YjbI with pentapeptide repeats/GTPase SAR1 family protein